MYQKFYEGLDTPKEKRETISFNDIASLFDKSVWDVSILTESELERVTNYPIKENHHPYGEDYLNPGPWDLIPVLVLARSGFSWDYTHYREAEEILENSKYDKWRCLYINFKEAAIASGLGVRARNSLVYNYRFGFDVHYAAIGLAYNIVDFPPERRINKKLWNRCTDCYDCVNACPAKAINAFKEQKEDYWMNQRACDNFIGFGDKDYPHIPSVKNTWHKLIHPSIPDEIVDDLRDLRDVKDLTGKDYFDFNENGYSYDGQVVRDPNGDAINVPLCRECTSQPRCSKWNGNFPYDQVGGKVKDLGDLQELLTHNKNKKQ